MVLPKENVQLLVQFDQHSHVNKATFHAYKVENKLNEVNFCIYYLMGECL